MDTAELPLDLPSDSKWAEAYRYAKDSVKIFRDLSGDHGGIVREAEAARILRVSKQRISQLLEQGKIRRVEVRDADGELLMTGVGVNSMLEWRKSVNTGGRPKKTA